MGRKYKVLDLFAGGGGFSRGFYEAGFSIRCAVENFKPVAETFKANFPDAEVIAKDIKKVGSEEITSVVEPDVIIGGPPCEPFTAANPKRMTNPLDRLYVDPMGRLVLEFIRMVADLKPKIFVMENVPQILEGKLKDALRREFKRACYDVYFNVLRAENYGCPSKRARVFLSNIKIKPEKEDKIVVVWDVIKDLEEINPDIPNHEYVPITRRKLKRIARLKWGQCLFKYSGAKGKLMNALERLHPFRLAPTVKGGSRFIHPFQNRLLTVREQARLMSFPDNHIFLGGRDTQFDQVGEAVPPRLARRIAEVVKERLREM